MLGMLQTEKCFKTYLKVRKRSYFFNDFKWRRMILYYTKKLPALIRGIISKHHSDFFYLICFHFFSTENKRKSDKEV